MHVPGNSGQVRRDAQPGAQQRQAVGAEVGTAFDVICPVALCGGSFATAYF